MTSHRARLITTHHDQADQNARLRTQIHHLQQTLLDIARHIDDGEPWHAKDEACFAIGADPDDIPRGEAGDVRVWPAGANP